MRVFLILLYGVAGFALAIITVSGLSPFGQPIAGIILPLIIVVDALLRLRTGQAFAATIGAGIAYEAIGGLPAGVACLAFLITTITIYSLISIVFAHYSFPAALASHFATSLIFTLIILITIIINSAGPISWLSHGSGIVAHTFVGTIWTMISRFIRSHLAKTLYVPPHDL